MDFCQKLAKLAPAVVRRGELGTSGEGRAMPLLILADPPVATPEQAAARGRPVVLALGNIHGGEVDGKEALLMLARDLAAARDHTLLKDLVILIAPVVNPDGAEKLNKANRPTPNGPADGVGVRTNAAGFDLNRDYIKLETPEVRAIVRGINQWNPALVIDTHTTNGSFHQYLITYDGPRNPTTDPALVKAVRDVLL